MGASHLSLYSHLVRFSHQRPKGNLESIIYQAKGRARREEAYEVVKTEVVGPGAAQDTLAYLVFLERDKHPVHRLVVKDQEKYDRYRQH